LHVYHGLHPYTSYPVVQGHEVSGTIEALGKGVRGFRKGETVIFMPQITCGKCHPCRNGSYHICDRLKVMGFQAPGAAQEFFAVDAEKVLSVGERISLDQAALIEPIAVAVHALGRCGGLRGKKVAVLGAGLIGNLVAQTAMALGATDVLVTDVIDYKLQKAVECGIRHAVNTSKIELGQAIRKAFGPDKADIILECVGSQVTIAQAVENARKGSTIVVVGVFGKKPEVDIGLVQDRELNLLGTLMYQRADFKKALALASSGKLQFGPLITHRYKFGDYQEAYEEIEKMGGRYMKVMIEL
jgi:L-iditol 2-dehydrogenase